MTITLLLNSEGKKMGKTQFQVLYGWIQRRQAHTISTSIGETLQMQTF